NDIRALFSEADAFVLPSRMESFGIAALEARCAGLPVIARTNTGVADFIEHRRSGMLAPTDRGFALAIAELIRNNRLHQAILSHNRSTMPPYSWDRVVDLTMAQYEKARTLA
ncbi:MAG: glycosyltransferase family 4 protein, partial [bacterium]